MKKILFLIALSFSCSSFCFAIDKSTEDLLCLMNLKPKTTTKEAAKSLLGIPTKVEENKKKAWWYYSQDNTKVVIAWDKKTDLLEKLSFTSITLQKDKFDQKLQGKLKSGSTDITQAIQLLGMPKDMTIKSVTQEMHYAYQNSVLRLFFRNRMLVDFTLLIQQ
jgi:LAS superfamily LD-carboxypeptidase LdcB